MKIVCEEGFLKSLRKDLEEYRDTWIIYQNVKWNVINIANEPCGQNRWGYEYEVEIELRKDIEQLDLLELCK